MKYYPVCFYSNVNITTKCCYIEYLRNSVQILHWQEENRNVLWHMLRSELIINVSCPITHFTLIFLISTPFPPVAALSWQPWQSLRSGGCLPPRSYTTHTSSSGLGGVCTCLYACMCLSVWACVRQTSPDRGKIFGSWGPAGWAVHLLSAAGSPDARVTAGKSLFKIGQWAEDTHKYILTPWPLKSRWSPHMHKQSSSVAETKCLFLSWVTPRARPGLN